MPYGCRYTLYLFEKPYVSSVREMFLGECFTGVKRLLNPSVCAIIPYHCTSLLLYAGGKTLSFEKDAT